jgi:hypothetical protein
MPDNFGLSYSELSEIRTINSELAAHNIALAYIQATAQVNKLNREDEVNSSDVLSPSNQYVQAYNYAYNFVVHENKIINEAE